MGRRQTASDLAVSSPYKALASAFVWARRRVPPAFDRPARLLVVKPGSLGDLLLAGPFLASLRRAFPLAHIALAVGSWARPAALGNPNLDQIVDIGPVGTPGAYGWREMAALARKIGREDFGAAFVLDRSPMMSALPWLAGIPLRVGLDSSGRGFSHTHRVDVLPGRHESELYQDVARRIGISAQWPERWFFPDPAARRRVAALLGRPDPDISGYLVVAPGGGVNPGARRTEKRWCPSGFAQVAGELGRTAGLCPVLVGDEADSDAVSRVAHLIDQRAVDLSGRLDFGELAALLEHCRLFIANDSATAHLGAAVAAVGTVIFTVTDPHVYAPPSAAVAVIDARSGGPVAERAITALLAGRGAGNGAGFPRLL